MENLKKILDNHIKWLKNEKYGIRADLRECNLEGADLRGADLQGAKKIPIFCKWPHGITDGQIHIGCQKRSVEEWKKFIESDEVIQTPRDLDEFKQIVRVIKAYIAYLE